MTCIAQKRIGFSGVIVAFHLFSIRVDAANLDEQDVEKLNIEIAAVEDSGDRKSLERVLASELAFRRANGITVGRNQFMKDVKARPKSQTRIESVTLHGRDRAIVTAIVTLKVDGQVP